MIVIIDYGMGNVGSILNMLKKIGVDAKISHNSKDIEAAEKLILPGVGAFNHGVDKLNEYKLVPLLNNKVLKEKCPILGICLGMQLLTKYSEEGDKKGLGWVNAITKKFSFDSIKQPKLKVPHMGWNDIQVKPTERLFENLINESRFYFVHSYFVECQEEGLEIASTFYGRKFTSAFRSHNIIGTQFHPEKSHKFGMTLMKNFAEMDT
jgi:glutamine amidotransferase